MIRARFHVEGPDPRPVIWPIYHPYWITASGISERNVEEFTLVAYADDLAQLQSWWPGARLISWTLAEQYTYTDRFPEPQWMTCDHEWIDVTRLDDQQVKRQCQWCGKVDSARGRPV